MDNVKDAANKAADAADSGLHQAAQATKQAVAYVSSKVQEASESSRGTFEQLQVVRTLCSVMYARMVLLLSAKAALSHDWCKKVVLPLCRRLSAINLTI